MLLQFHTQNTEAPTLNNMATASTGKKTVCVTGGNGFLGSSLVKSLLENGYIVHTTVRDPDNKKKISHLLKLQVSGSLKIFPADLVVEGSFDAAVSGCDIVFHVATPVQFYSEDQENDMVKPAIRGTLNVLKACLKAKKTVKRVVFTSSASAVSVNELTGTGIVIDENCWTDVDYLISEKSPFWGYPVSKTLAEKEAWKFAKENNIDLITVIPSMVAGPFITPEAPGSVLFSMSLLTGDELQMNGLKNMIRNLGSICFVHVEDVCRAHIYLAEKESASGRYICNVFDTNFMELAQFLHQRYPQYNVPTNFGDLPHTGKTILSSEKLIKEGFIYKYGLEEIYDHSVEYFKEKGLLHK